MLAGFLIGLLVGAGFMWAYTEGQIRRLEERLGQD